jgi:hypothetical protein
MNRIIKPIISLEPSFGGFLSAGLGRIKCGVISLQSSVYPTVGKMKIVAIDIKWLQR